MHKPELLLLDEPTTGVDPQSRNHLFEAVRRLNESGLTVIYTSHYMEEVQALCPRLAILDHGRIIAEDTLSLLLARLPTVLRGVPPAGLSVEEFAARPWVQSVRWIGPALEWTTQHLSEFLPHCPPGFTDLVIEPPTLERVFLTLTGTDLRDE
jgi:ABC-2 type transport system ATP-binding protein